MKLTLLGMAAIFTVAGVLLLVARDDWDSALQKNMNKR